MIFFSESWKFLLGEPKERPDWVLFGVPYDCTATFNTGARFGPDAIREASYHMELFDCETGVDLTAIDVRDIGNVNVRLGDSGATCEMVRKAVAEIEGPFIALGGEHTISHFVVAARPPEVVVSLDAHLDLRNEYLGEPLSHGCTCRRILEVCEAQIYGYRECSREEYTFLKERRIPAYTPSQLGEIAYPEGKKVHLSIDMDVLDPSEAPNVSNPVPGGLRFGEVVHIVEEVMRRNEVVSLDLCEVCSRYADRTAVTAALLLFKTLAVWWKLHGK